MRKVKLGDIFKLEKGSLQSSKCSPGQYDFITAAEDWKTHESYTHDCEAIVYAVAASGSLGRAHYVNGKFIASDLCFIMQEKDKEKYSVNFQFYQIIFEVLRDEIVSKTKTGTSKESISQKNLSKYEIPYFDYDFQIANYERLVRTKQIIAEILKETESQKAYAKQLRQNILQDAIEGKLTAEWRKTHPVIKGNPDFDAEALFEEIQKGKEKYKDDPLLKRDKPRRPVSEEEKEFQIPKSWNWCRMGQICYPITKGTTPDVHEITSSGEVPYIKMYNIVNQKLDFDYRPQFISNNVNDTVLARSKTYPNDVIMNIVGPPMGKIAMITDEYPVWNLNQAMAIFRSYIPAINKYIYLFLNSMIWLKYVQVLGVVGQDNMSLEQCKDIAIPLPPIIEQEEIIKQFDIVSNKLNQLEQQISQREEYANQLMQSILKDAFEER